MKKILSSLLILCVALLFTACDDGVTNQENEVKNEFEMELVQTDVESITLQYENFGQYHLPNESMARFIELFNQSEVLQNGNSEQDEETCVVVINKVNGGYLLLDMYENTDYHFLISEYDDNKLTQKYPIQNTALVGFVEEVIDLIVPIENVTG